MYNSLVPMLSSRNTVDGVPVIDVKILEGIMERNGRNYAHVELTSWLMAHLVSLTDCPRLFINTQKHLVICEMGY